jgi:L-proline amide hydrolase
VGRARRTTTCWRYAELAARTGRAVVHYDQLGVGNSTHLPEKGADFWQVPLFVEELDNLLARSRHRRALSCARPVLGRDAGRRACGAAAGGAALAGDFELAGVDGALGSQEANKLRELLPPEVQATLLRHEADGTTSDPAYEAAVRVFDDRHVCRIPWPTEVEASFAAIAADPTVYHTMNGPSEFHCIGTIKDWSIIDRLHLVRAPTLLLPGRHDEATPAVVQPFADHIPDVRWTIMEHSSHMPHVEEPEATLAVVAEFLAAHDT